MAVMGRCLTCGKPGPLGEVHRCGGPDPRDAEIACLRRALEWYADISNYDEETGAPGRWGRTPSTPDFPPEGYFDPDHGAHAREALAHVAPKPENSDTSGASVAASDTSPGPTAARLARAVNIIENHRSCENPDYCLRRSTCENCLMRDAFLAEPATRAEAEHAALVRVAKAALDYWAYETKTNREGLRAALTELRRKRAGKDGGNDERN